MVTQSAFHVTAVGRKRPEISDFAANHACCPLPSRTREDTRLLNVKDLRCVDSTRVPEPNSIEVGSRSPARNKSAEKYE